MTSQEELIATLAAEQGWTPREIEYMLEHVQAPLEGFRHSILSANTLRVMGNEARRMYDMCLYERDPITREPYAPRPGVSGRLHHSVTEFEGEEADEGKTRRNEARMYAKEFRACLSESRRHYAQAAYFQGMLASADFLSSKPAQEADPVEEEEDEDAATERRHATELAKRLNAVAAGTAEYLSHSYGKRTKNQVKREAKAGLKAVEADLAEAAETMGQCP